MYMKMNSYFDTHVKWGEIKGERIRKWVIKLNREQKRVKLNQFSTLRSFVCNLIRVDD